MMALFEKLIEHSNCSDNPYLLYASEGSSEGRKAVILG